MSATTWASVLTLPVSPSRDHILGPTNAAATLVEYGDYQCPFCALASAVVNDVRARLGKRLCFVFRHFPLATVHPRATIAAEAAEAAGVQHMFWEMHEILYRNQSQLEDADLIAYATALRLDLTLFQDDLVSHAHLPKIREDFMSGVRSGVNGTPTFFIDGERYDGSWETAPLLAALQHAAAQHAAANK
jgi:protein-disulfide isomerase